MKTNINLKHFLLFTSAVFLFAVYAFTNKQDEFFWVQQNLPGIYSETKNYTIAGNTEVSQRSQDPVCLKNEIRLTQSDGSYEWRYPDCTPALITGVTGFSTTPLTC